jgi:AcrR family transcriptional regulator
MPKIVRDETIYQAAIEAVIERGYTGATTKQIADAAGISEVTLFRKYGSKAELVKRAIVSIVEQIDFESTCRYSGDVAGDLLCVTTVYQDIAEKYTGFYHTILAEVPRHPELSGLVSIPLNMISGIGDLIKKYQQEGILVEEPSLDSVTALLGPLIVANMLRNAAPDLALPEVNLQKHVQQFLNGRRPPVAH